MIKLNKLIIANFMGYGSSPTVFDLMSTKSTLITGINGAGKSTIIDGICFALFNKPFRNATKPSVVNTINNKACSVRCTFSIGTNEYVVIRGIKPNIFEIWKNGELIDQEAANGDYQTFLEDHILQINYKTFIQIVIVSAANFKPFMQLPAGDRRNVVEDLLDAQIFSSMAKITKDKLAIVVKDIGIVDGAIRNLTDKISMLQSFILKVKNETESNDKEIDTKIAEYENYIKELDCY